MVVALTELWDAQRCAGLLQKAKKMSGGYWVACCPAHEDRDPSLLLNDGQDGGLILRCFAGCDYRQIAQRLEGMGAQLRERPRREDPFEEHPQLGRPHQYWDYHDAGGRIVLRICRWEQPGGKKDIRPLSRTLDGWRWAQAPDPRPLYQLDVLLARAEAPVLMVEGEKAAAAAQKLFPSYVATTWAGGANATGHADWSKLADRTVVLVPDCDDAGRKAMSWAAQALGKVGAHVRIVDPRQFDATLPEGWDFADALAQGRDISGWLDAPTEEPSKIPGVLISWRDLIGKTPPERKWVIPYWLPAGHISLLAGRGGIGKSLLAQHLGTAIAAGARYLEQITPQRVLMWASEDDHAELWRRQINISSYLAAPLESIESFSVRSCVGCDVTLGSLIFGALSPAPMLSYLKQEVHDLNCDLVILDNIARIYGGNENDRHQVTTFLAWLQEACAPAAILLLGHPAKVSGSEFSGSSAWEGAVRARLYFSDRPPDQQPKDDDDEEPIDPSVRYLSRRKANYSELEMRLIHMRDGALVPDEPERHGRSHGSLDAQEAVLVAATKLAERGIFGTASTASQTYLPKLAKQYGLLGGTNEAGFSKAMRKLVMDGRLKSAPVGLYSNRTPRQGLVVNAQMDRTNGS